MSKRLASVLRAAEAIDPDANPSPSKARQVASTYNITADEYTALAQRQEGRCAICRGKSNRSKLRELKYLSVDHDHADGTVRGLLCNNCNAGLGMFKDNPTLLKLAALYLEIHHETERLW